MKIKRKGQSVQELMGIKSFTEYGLATNRGELLFFFGSPHQYIGIVPNQRRKQNPSSDDGAVNDSGY